MKPANSAQITPTITIVVTGVWVVGLTRLNKPGSIPSRDIANMMRVRP